MSTTQERVDGAVQDGVDPLRVILERQRQAFMAEGPPSVAVRRNRIDRLLALVLDTPTSSSTRWRPISAPGPRRGRCSPKCSA